MRQEEEEEEKCARVCARGRHLCPQRRSREEQQRGKTVGLYSFLHILFSFYLTESYDDGFILEPRQRQAVVTVLEIKPLRGEIPPPKLCKTVGV